MNKYIFEDGVLSITKTQFKTRRKTYMISKIEKIEVNYAFLFLLPIALFLVFLCRQYSLFMYSYEIIAIYIFSFFSIVISLSLGVIRIHSRSMQETAVLGFIPNLKKIRSALDEAMDLREYSDNGAGL